MDKHYIIVIGSAGNLGKYFIDHLLNSLDLEKYIILATGRDKKYRYTFYNGEYVQLDITNKEDFNRLPNKNVYAVVDFAGAMPAYIDNDNPYQYIDVNITGTLNILEYCRRVKVKRFLFMHTWAELIGNLKDSNVLDSELGRKMNYNDDHAIYTVSKNAAVDLVKCYNELYGIDAFIFKLPNIYLYSPEKFYYVDCKKQYISYRYMIDRAISGEDIELWGNPTFGKDFIYVKDLNQILFKALFVDRKYGEYVVGTGVKTPMKEQIEGIIKVFCKDKKSKIINCPDKRDCQDYIINIDKLKNELGYEPQYYYLDYLKDYKKEMELNRFIKRM